VRVVVMCWPRSRAVGTDLRKKVLSCAGGLVRVFVWCCPRLGRRRRRVSARRGANSIARTLWESDRSPYLKSKEII
jgi:hypothetical protein